MELEATSLIKIATWIRAEDTEYFSRAFSSFPDLTLCDAREQAVDVGTCDGLLLTGGWDISGCFLKQDNIDASLIEGSDAVRDAWEIEAVRETYARRLPIFVICRGLQILNVAMGGTLCLHIEGHRHFKDENAQPLKYLVNSPYQFERVNSNHHQALDKVAPTLEIEAVHATDGIIEQVRIRDYPWGFGVQYHPERDVFYSSFFKGFAKACQDAKFACGSRKIS
ncbi:MAG: gamma-glutamyl-gamma-aminobutyrate hydrolase family protein [Chthoniobacterales bacterium]